MWYLHLRPSPVSPSAHAFHGQKTLFYEEDCELCVSVQVPVRALSLVCARELLQCWGQDGPSSSQFCWMSSRRPVRAAVLGSHTAMVLPCPLVEWWECSVGPPSPISKEDLCLTCWFSGLWGQVHTLAKWISSKWSSVLKLAMLKVKISFSFITRTYF